LNNCTISTALPDQQVDNSIVHVCMPEGSRCAFAKRQLVNINKEPVIDIRLPATTHYGASLDKTLKEGESIDWVQWQRARLERQMPPYPGKARVEHALTGGSLVIGGGGGMPEEVWKRFVELAGGKNSRIVILPTAIEDPKAEPAFEERVLKLAGAEHVVTLPQHHRNEVETSQFLAELDQATGVWFGGGRQWRFVDAYWGTPAWEKLQDVCKRGGVIGGSSAGATIQGDLLVRGAPAGNHIMIADGYRRGLGLLPGVAIDQHFAQRNRFKELEGCLADYPTICGIGIDEQTALVVKAPHQCSVIGTGSVWHYPSYDVTEELKSDRQSRAAMRVEYKSGSAFSLVPN
jgi:cyanophycinase